MIRLRETMREIVREYTLAEIKEAAIREAMDMWGNDVTLMLRLGVTYKSLNNYRARYDIPKRNRQARLMLRKP